MSVAPPPKGVRLTLTRGGLDEPFYVPSFRLEIGTKENRLLPIWDVTRITYKDAVNQIDSFEVVLSNANWDPGEIRYSGQQWRSSPVKDKPTPILPGAFVRLWLGYETRMGLYPMLTGRVTAVSPSFTDGVMSVTLRALSTLEAFREKKKNKRWEEGKKEVTDSYIADRIATGYHVELIPLKNLQETPEPSVTQNETDISFLISRAKARGYVVIFRETLPPISNRSEKGAIPKKVMYFGPSDLLQRDQLVSLGDRPDGPLELAWGTSLAEFKPTLNVSTNIWSSVGMSFWDRRKKAKLPPERYDLEQLWSDEGVNADLADYLRPLIQEKALGEGEVTNAPVHTELQALTLARNTLRENFLQLITADGSTVGTPEIRAGSRVLVTGIGFPFDGGYFLTSTTHTFDDSGYRTQFSARRENQRGDTT